MSDIAAHPAQDKPSALHFGAGNIGRGFVGALLANSGYHVIFSDVSKVIIDALNQHHTYEVKVLDEQEHTETVRDVEGLMSRDDAVIRYLADARTRIVTTAVGAPVLEKIAPVIAKGLQARRKAGAGPLNIIACENMVHQTDKLKMHVLEHLPAGSETDDRTWIDAHVGFANCAVDRIVPGGELDEAHPLDVATEAFFEWIVDETALRIRIEPLVESMVLTDRLDAYIERKIFTLNCGHAATAYLGAVHGHATIDAAIADPKVKHVVRGALGEGGKALVKKHGFGEKEHAAYIDKIVERFENAKLSDSVERVGKQPLRKLGREDRLLGPAYMAREYGLPIDNLAKAIAAAFLFNVQEDEESVQLMKKVKDVGIDDAVAEVTGFKKGGEEHKTIVDSYRELQHQK
jgi:mannitol-1-phosphate 5-dehydrogenase